ncbi:hypothetical protein QBC35DRAFT_470486 [Podospora australis]|uniref:Uncharacterized protein n=1 Tax=Podospora australis TaxID=1536484 RepID=A0AAN7AM63_9PEZI|nr:hypothetical protein QBC35DRAFT_470486 [Podospora australis]
MRTAFVSALLALAAQAVMAVPTVSTNSTTGVIKREDIPAGIAVRGLDEKCDDNTAYCGYTSRISDFCNGVWGCEGCTAIFTCNYFGGYCAYGWWLKQQFDKVYSEVGCGRCGTYTIPDGNPGLKGCRATLNFCSSCKQDG